MSNGTVAVEAPATDESNECKARSRELSDSIDRAVLLLQDIDRNQATIDSLEVEQSRRRHELDDLSRTIEQGMHFFDVDRVISILGFAFWLDDDGDLQIRKTVSTTQAISSEAD